MRTKSNAASPIMAATLIVTAVLIGFAPAQRARPAEVYGPADPVQKEANRFDPKRPIRREMQTDVADGVGVVRASVTAP